jgi:hypothetical protein
MVWALGLALVLASPGLAWAGDIRLTIKNGRVALVARDATLRDILAEWERVGGTRIVNRDRVPGTRLTLEFSDVSEEQALKTLLRPIAGYLAARRVGPEGGSSAFSRIVLMPALATPASAVAAAPVRASGPSGGGQPGMGGPPSGRPGMQRRVLPDGRVVTVMDDPQQANEPDVAEQEQPGGIPPGGMMRPPFNAPPRPQGEAASDPPAAPTQPGQVMPGTSAMPTMPSVTVAVPGALPVTKPGAAPPPIKPPGD